MSLYENFAESIGISADDRSLRSLHSLVLSGKNTFSLNHKVMEKNVDLSWVEAIEEGMKHLDNVLRRPSKTIEDVEAIVPIALSKKITVESVKYLAQHTNLIQDYDPVSKKVTPSKVLNIYKEESMLTYENKFINTLIDRLFIFINRRYDKLKEVSKDESVFALGYDAVLGEESSNLMKLHISLETTKNLEVQEESSSTVWERIEKIKRTVESYKSSKFCQSMGKAYIRPPVMRTNAILKNVDLKACLTLWQFIESYDKIGYELNISDTAQKPGNTFTSDFYMISALALLAFRSHTDNDSPEVLKVKKSKPAAPKIIKKFDKESPEDYDMDVGVGENGEGGKKEFSPLRALPDDANDILEELDSIIETERAFFEAEAEKERIAREQAEERERRRQEELRRIEQERIAAAIREEQERMERERLEKERLIEQQRKEQEERERLEREEKERKEAERIEKERIEREEKERLEAAERERLEREMREQSEEERLRKEKEEKERAERLAAEKAARLEREKHEAERAMHLREARKLLEKKPFEQIYFEYSRDPIIVMRRYMRKYLLKIGLIKPKTDFTPEELGIIEIENRCLELQRIEDEKKRLEEEHNPPPKKTFREKLTDIFKKNK